MNKTRKISSLLWTLLLAWGSVNAAGLGKLTIQSSLGLPLKAEIELLSVNKDDIADITARLATVEAFKQARIERQEALGSLRFRVDQRANGQPIIRITSTAAVQDPFLDMLIELNWSSGRLIREYTLLLDPPAATKTAEAIRPAVVAETPRTETKSEAPIETPKPKVKPTPPVQAAPVPKTYGPVKSGETLRAIAGKVKPAEVSLEQMMVGLYQANKDAFQGNNVNRLNRGSVLKVPDSNAALAIDRSEAAKTIRGHAVEWHAYRRKLAETAGEMGVAESHAAGKIAPQKEVQPPSAPGAPKDVLKLSKGEPGTGGKPDGKTQERMRAMEEELAAKGRALQEAQDRVSQLERTVRDMQKLLEMKAQEAAKAPPAPPAPPAVEPPLPKLEEELAPEPEVAPEPPAAPAPAPIEKPKPAPVIAPLPIAEPSSSWISTFISNPIYIGGIVAALLLSGLLWMMMVGSKRRQGLTKFEDSIMTGGEFKNNAVFNASSGNVASGAATEGSMLLTDFSRLGMGAIDSHEVDPIAEAEVYMAYGRDAQAEEILREALVKDPTRYEIALKLLELYASRKDTTSFETTASELYAGLSGQNTPVWQRAAEMGRSIDPQNPLYRVVTPQASSSTAPAATASAVGAAASVAAAAAPSAAASKAVDFGDLEQLASLDDWGDSASVGAQEAAKTGKPDLDFVPEGKPLVAEPAAAEPAHEEFMAFDSAPAEADFEAPRAVDTDFDHSLDLNPIGDFEQAQAPAEVGEEGGGANDSEPFAPADDMSLEFEPAEALAAPAEKEEALEFAAADFDMPSDLDAGEPETSAAEEMPVLDLSGIDLELGAESSSEFESLESPAVEQVDETASPAKFEMDTEFDPFAELPAAADFEPEAEALDGADVDEAALALESEPVSEVEAESDMDPELREEVNTKLDLARAYMEMGDREGAREILQEVLGEGDKQQKAEAEKLMAEAA